jgi:hypothetical protein
MTRIQGLLSSLVVGHVAIFPLTGTATTTETLSLVAQALIQKQVDSGTFVFPGAANSQLNDEKARGHCAALTLVLTSSRLKDPSLKTRALRWIEFCLNKTSAQETETTETNSWQEAAWRLRLLAAAKEFKTTVPHGEEAFLRYAESALESLALLQDSDGLFWSDAKRTRKELLANLEILAGLKAANTLFMARGNRQQARRALSMVNKVIDGIENKFWQPHLGRYAWALDPTSGPLTRAERWAPDMVSQLAAVAYLPSHSALRELFESLSEALPRSSDEIKSQRELAIAAWYLAAARNSGEGSLYRLLSEKILRTPPSVFSQAPPETLLLIVENLPQK